MKPTTKRVFKEASVGALIGIVLLALFAIAGCNDCPNCERIELVYDLQSIVKDGDKYKIVATRKNDIIVSWQSGDNHEVKINQRPCIEDPHVLVEFVEVKAGSGRFIKSSRAYHVQLPESYKIQKYNE